MHTERGPAGTVRTEREMRLGRGLEAALNNAVRQPEQLALEPLHVRGVVPRHGWFVGTLQVAVDDLHALGPGLEGGEGVDESLSRVGPCREGLWVKLAESVALPVEDESAGALVGEDVHHSVHQQAATADVEREGEWQLGPHAVRCRDTLAQP